MLRRILLVVMAVAVSFGMTACSGYLLYTISEGRSEGHLSLMIRFMFNPTIAVVVGVLVGLLSKDRPALTSIVGLVPWILMLLGLKGGGVLSDNLAKIGAALIYLLLAAASAALAWRLRRGRMAAKGTKVDMHVTHS